MSELCVIVATAGRPRLLRALLDALRSQTVGTGAFDLHVVIDGGDPETETLLREVSPSWGGEMGWSSTPVRRGPAAARNIAIAATHAPIVVMTDDDCVPAPGWLAAVEACMRRCPDAGFMFGKTVTQDDRLTPFSHYVVNLTGAGHQTCNCAYRRELLSRLGGFDERFPFAYLEDTDLFCRAREVAPYVFCEDALVLHPPRESGPAQVVAGYRRFEADFIFAAKSPQWYRTRHGGHGPLREVMGTVALRHTFRRLWDERRWLRAAPALYLKFAAAMVFAAVSLWCCAPIWAFRHRRASAP